jgi:hypothetical protein
VRAAFAAATTAMAQVQILRNELPDAAVAHRFEQEILEAVAMAGAGEEPLACAILDEGLHAEIEIELPGWTERVSIPYPARAGDVRRALKRLLMELGLMDAPSVLRLADLSRGY